MKGAEDLALDGGLTALDVVDPVAVDGGDEGTPAARWGAVSGGCAVTPGNLALSSRNRCIALPSSRPAAVSCALADASVRHKALAPSSWISPLKPGVG